MMSAGKFGRYTAEVEERIERTERIALQTKVKSEKHLRDIRGVEGRSRNGKKYLHGPTDFAKTLKLRFLVGDLDLPERRKRYTCSLEEEEIGAQMCPCGKAIESRTHIVGGCEIDKEERDVLQEEMREIDDCDMEEFDTLDSSEKTIAILGDRW